jgi:predicted short-subunit dehydrogenase-like oxidoreductase (DUF2520 family)
VQTINFIGAGRVGQTLGRLWRDSGALLVQDVLTRSMDSARQACEFMGHGVAVTHLEEMRPADLWLLAVQDANIGDVAQALAQADAGEQKRASAMKAEHASAQGTLSEGHAEWHAAIVFHCSGALGSDLLAPLAAQGWHCASAHCILSFATPALAVAQFAGTPCALEGDARACAALEAVFKPIGAQCFSLELEHKLIYHAAAVFATNFLPVLQQTAEEAWRAAGVPQSLLPDLRQRLLGNAAANIARLGPMAALTGPAAREDTVAIARQARAVTDWDAEAGRAYEALSALALRMAKAHREASASTASNR